MSSELASVRAEIKAWERSFRNTNGRNPTINDIKQQPTVAQKYKLYKKLSKAVTIPPESTLEPKGLPFTPPRQTSSASNLTPKLLFSASRFVETNAPLECYNPFSPRKKDKGKQRELTPSTSTTTSHLFASPQKSKLRILETQPSPIRSQSTHASTSPRLPQELPSAISRARKRLRGEPGSPSPNKEKRRRVSPAILPLPKLRLQALEYDTDSNGEEDNNPDGSDSSFVDDSPMKPAVNGKAFTTLFQETIKPTFTSELSGGSALAVKARADVKLLRTELPDMDMDIFNDDSRSIKKPSFKPGSSMKSYVSALTKSRSKLIKSTLPILNNARKRSPSQTRASDESMLSSIDHGNGTVTDDTKELQPFVKLPSSTPQLLPPSPNPNTSRLQGRSKSNGARTIQPSKSNNHKKPRLRDRETVEDTENDDGGSSDDLNMRHAVKIVHHSRGIRTLLAGECDSEIKDPILSCIQHRSQGSASLAKQGDNDDTYAIVDEDQDTGANVSVDDEEFELPNRLHRNLVLESLKSKSRQTEYEQERIVRGLLSGRRVLHYDPKKGGEIWDVGEDERDELAGDKGGIDNSDEWEGDPVPWQVGELSETRYHLEELR